MAVTAEGLIIERFPELLESIETEERIEIDPNVNTGSDTIIGQLNSIIANRDADLWELVQSVYDARNLDRAEGLALDDLVTILGISRVGAISTFGIQNFTGADGTTIPVGTTVRNPNVLENFLTTVQVVITAADCRDCTISVATLLDSTDYDITINGVEITFPSGVSATRAEIITGLDDAIFTAAIPNVSTDIDETIPLNHKLTISITGETNLTVEPSTLLAIESVTGQVNVSAENTGPIIVSADTISQIVTAVAGITATINTEAFTTGRNEETDEELRARAKLSTQIAGTATPEAITRTVLAVEGVTFVTVQENITLIDTTIVAKGYEVTVEGGTDAAVGLAVWRSKPAGIETDGSTTEGIIDAFGNAQSVKFSRPTVVDYQVNVDYTLYSEETFPTNGEQLIKDEVVAFSLTLGLGEDVIGQRFTASIFTNIPGIESLVITVDDGSGFDPIITIDANELSEITAPTDSNISVNLV